MKSRGFLKRHKGMLILALMIALISMTVIDNNAMFEIEALRNSWFGDIWMWFLSPGITILVLPCIFLFAPIGMVLTWIIPDLTMAGFIDGGPIDKYFFFFFSIVLGLVYSFVIVNIYLLIKYKLLRK